MSITRIATVLTLPLHSAAPSERPPRAQFVQLTLTELHLRRFKALQEDLGEGTPFEVESAEALAVCLARKPPRKDRQASRSFVFENYVMVNGSQLKIGPNGIQFSAVEPLGNDVRQTNWVPLEELEQKAA